MYRQVTIVEREYTFERGRMRSFHVYLTEIQNYGIIGGMNEQMMFPEEIAKIQPRGILTIPKKLRRSMGLTDNTLVKISGNKYRLVIEPVRTIPYPVRSYTADEVDDFLESDAQESKKLETQGLL